MTVEQQDRFLDELSVSGSFAFACGAAGCTLKEAFVARRDDQAFQDGWFVAIELARKLFRARQKARMS